MKNDPKLPHFCRAIFHLKLRISSGSHAFSPAKSNGCASDFKFEYECSVFKFEYETLTKLIFVMTKT